MPDLSREDVRDCSNCRSRMGIYCSRAEHFVDELNRHLAAIEGDRIPVALVRPTAGIIPPADGKDCPAWGPEPDQPKNPGSHPPPSSKRTHG